MGERKRERKKEERRDMRIYDLRGYYYNYYLFSLNLYNFISTCIIINIIIGHHSFTQFNNFYIFKYIYKDYVIL